MTCRTNVSATTVRSLSELKVERVCMRSTAASIKLTFCKNRCALRSSNRERSFGEVECGFEYRSGTAKKFRGI